MSFNAKDVKELLAELYTERDDRQWQTVATCLDELVCGTVISLQEVATLAFGLEDKESLSHKKVISRANKLNGRVGKAGNREVNELCLACIKLASTSTSTKYDKLVAHAFRVLFIQKEQNEYVDLAQNLKDKLLKAIANLTRKQKEYPQLVEPLNIEAISKAIKLRDEYFHDEIWRIENNNSIIQASIMGVVDIWDALDKILSTHSYPYPYEYELRSAEVCIQANLKSGEVKLDNLKATINKYRNNDLKNTPLLTAISGFNEVDLISANAQDIALQILLEMLYVREVRK